MEASSGQFEFNPNLFLCTCIHMLNFMILPINSRRTKLVYNLKQRSIKNLKKKNSLVIYKGFETGNISADEINRNNKSHNKTSQVNSVTVLCHRNKMK